VAAIAIDRRLHLGQELNEVVVARQWFRCCRAEAVALPFLRKELGCPVGRKGGDTIDLDQSACR
jgi:hypothetical protein